MKQIIFIWLSFTFTYWVMAFTVISAHLNYFKEVKQSLKNRQVQRSPEETQRSKYSRNYNFIRIFYLSIWSPYTLLMNKHQLIFLSNSSNSGDICIFSKFYSHCIICNLGEIWGKAGLRPCMTWFFGSR